MAKPLVLGESPFSIITDYGNFDDLRDLLDLLGLDPTGKLVVAE